MQKLLPSIQSLYIEMKYNGTKLGSGTAFIVTSDSKHFLVTNRHIVTGRHNITGEVLSPTGGIPNQMVIYHNHSSIPDNWIRVTEHIYNDNNEHLWFEHPRFGANADIVALQLTELSDVNLIMYSLEKPERTLRILPSDIVSVVGFPFGLTSTGYRAIWSTGFIASEIDVDYDGKPVFLIDCRARPGQSGSAVIAQRNSGNAVFDDNRTTSTLVMNPITNFLGIYSGRINEKSDLGMVWKANAIKELVDSIK